MWCNIMYVCMHGCTSPQISFSRSELAAAEEMRQLVDAEEAIEQKNHLGETDGKVDGEAVETWNFGNFGYPVLIYTFPMFSPCSDVTLEIRGRSQEAARGVEGLAVRPEGSAQGEALSVWWPGGNWLDCVQKCHMPPQKHTNTGELSRMF